MVSTAPSSAGQLPSVESALAFAEPSTAAVNETGAAGLAGKHAHPDTPSAKSAEAVTLGSFRKR
jgi:hypothetical protein